MTSLLSVCFLFLDGCLCIPVWYFIIKKVITKEKLPALLVFFSILYLICSPSFSIYVQWASCLEHFIANTAGLLSGYLLYSSIRYQNEKITHANFGAAGSILFGVISLFTYQNGFGSFFLPFIIYLAAKPKNIRIILIGIVFCFFIYGIYYFLFKYNLRANNIEAVGRTNISIDLFPKIRFFFGRALAIPFHFNYLFNEKDLTGAVVYAIILFTWMLFDLRISGLSLIELTETICIFNISPGIDLPALLDCQRKLLFQQNFAGFKHGCFLSRYKHIAGTHKKTRKKNSHRINTFFLVGANARHNFVRQFLNPVQK